MAESSRVYHGLDVSWPTLTGQDDDPIADRVLAEVDVFGPTAAEHTSTHLRVFFASRGNRDDAVAHIGQGMPLCRVASVSVADEHWAERSQASLAAVKVGGLTIAPPWDLPAERGGLIIIQPSMGFGTGHHASTRLCLRLLQDAPVSGAIVLDAGTGSGVLAIAAWKLGAASVVAVDFDDDAVTSALECAALNDISDVIDFRRADLEAPSPIAGEPFSLILANLTGGLLVRMAERLCGLAAPAGTLILSGILGAEEEDVTQAFANCGAQMAARLAEDDWIGLRLTIPTPPTRQSMPR